MSGAHGLLADKRFKDATQQVLRVCISCDDLEITAAWEGQKCLAQHMRKRIEKPRSLLAQVAPRTSYEEKGEARTSVRTRFPTHLFGLWTRV